MDLDVKIYLKNHAQPNPETLWCELKFLLDWELLISNDSVGKWKEKVFSTAIQQGFLVLFWGGFFLSEGIRC